MKAGNNNRLCIRKDHTESSSSSNASMRGKEMGDIGMLKGGFLAWKLCYKRRVVDDVVDHTGSIGLGVYRREEGGEIINIKQT